MNLASMLKTKVTPLTTPKKTWTRNTKPGVSVMRAKAEARYREAMHGQELSTKEIAYKLGCVNPSNINKTLHNLADRGKVRCSGNRGREYLWVWIGK